MYVLSTVFWRVIDHFHYQTFPLLMSTTLVMQVTVLVGPMHRDIMGSSPSSRRHLHPRLHPRRFQSRSPHRPRFVLSRLISSTATTKMLCKITPSTHTCLLLRSRSTPLVSLPSLRLHSRRRLGGIVYSRSWEANYLAESMLHVL
jgi:hypothetical protein